MNLIIFGPPGSGKGTYASRLAPKLGIVHIATGDIFRDEMKRNTELGKKVREYYDKGQLVPDNIVIDVTKKAVNSPETKNGFILDGVVRTVEQAKAFEKVAKIDALINLIVPLDVIVARLSSRETCKSCGTIYNKLYLKSRIPGVCDKCGGELYVRDDDKPEAVKVRFEVYEKQIKPVLDYYKGKVTFANVECNDVNISADVMVEKILKELKKLKLV